MKLSISNAGSTHNSNRIYHEDKIQHLKHKIWDSACGENIYMPVGPSEDQNATQKQDAKDLLSLHLMTTISKSQKGLGCVVLIWNILKLLFQTKSLPHLKFPRRSKDSI